jgi:hypothetical protein
VVHKASHTPQLVIQKDGSTSLTEVAHRFYLDGRSGSGPALKYHGNHVTAGEFGKWTPIGAIQTATGYDVAWKNTGSGQYTVWSTDRNGNYKGSVTGRAVSGTSYALESLEPVFHQDLNRDGAIGLYVRPDNILTVNQALVAKTESAIIGRGATLELTAAGTASVTFAGSTGTLRLDHSSTFTGTIFGFTGDGKLSNSDHIDLADIKYSSIKDSYVNGVLTVMNGSGDTAKLHFKGSYTLANFKFASDDRGGTIVYDPPVSSSSGQDATGPGPGVRSGAIVAGETPELTELPELAFNLESARGYLLDSNAVGGIVPRVGGIANTNAALLGHYMASTFAVAGNHGAATTFTEVAQPNNQTMLSNPHHA